MASFIENIIRSVRSSYSLTDLLLSDPAPHPSHFFEITGILNKG